jgi:hypothetical protein
MLTCKLTFCWFVSRIFVSCADVRAGLTLSDNYYRAFRYRMPLFDPLHHHEPQATRPGKRGIYYTKAHADVGLLSLAAPSDLPGYEGYCNVCCCFIISIFLLIYVKCLYA